MEIFNKIIKSNYIPLEDRTKFFTLNLLISVHNKLFINREKRNYSYLFTVNNYILDDMQMNAIITDEKNFLLIAGAGSGKTLTIVGKINYLIKRLNIKESEILCISFTNATVDNLKHLLNKKYNYDIDVFTFHKLSMNIIKNYDNNIKICNSSTLEYIIDEFFLSNFSNVLNDRKVYNMLKNTILTFINLFKSNNYDVLKFDEILYNQKYDENYILLKIIKHIYIEYELELKSKNELDFNDMINNAARIVNNRGMYKNYKYIIIDEYQDTSYSKYKLIKEIQDKINCKLFCVGDDFQSIYRFTGCDLDIFLKFKQYFSYSKIMKIKNTYRNSKELIYVSGSFVMKNKNQINKKLKSNKSLNRPIKIVYFNNINKSFEKLIRNIYSEYKNKILILGRNNTDIYKIINNNFILCDNGNIKYNKNSKIDLRYLTVHKSKGLEEENVIIINLENKINGFPNKIKNESVLNHVLRCKDNYPYEEERRLFYVALTRTKNNVYLMVNNKNESIFVKELIKNYKHNIQIINELI